MSVTVQLSDCQYDSSHHMSIIPPNSPYKRFKSIPSSREWEQSRKAKKFRRAFPNYDLLLHALDVSSIYLSDSRHVAPPKSGEDAHVTHGRCDLGGTAQNKPRLGFSYMLPRLWDPGGVGPTPNVPRDQSRTLATSRYPYAPHKGHLVNLTSLQQWQDLRMLHMNFNIFIHGNTTEINNAMTKTTGLINIIIPALMQPTLTNHEHCILCMAYECPYDRQSSHTSFTATATSYIWVTKN